MKLIVGLGNPGPKYKNTRHNSGFLFLDYVAEKSGFEFAFDNKFNADIANHDQNIYLKPMTFMNNSGESVGQALAYFKLEPSDMILVHDDIAFEVGEYKVSNTGSSGRHNGVQSVIDHLGTQDFTRLRLGIGWDRTRPIILEDYVLTSFTSEEQERLLQGFKRLELSTLIGG